jgi:hypothetical protein
VGKDLILSDAIDGDLLDDTGLCDFDGSMGCPGGPAPFQPDPFDADVRNTHRLTFMHDSCARLRAQDI